MTRIRHPNLLPLCTLLACLLAHTFGAEVPDARANGATIEWPSTGLLSIPEDDTLEFTLKLPAAIIENASEDALPTIEVALVESVPLPASPFPLPPSPRVLALRSARPGEWIVHVRGLKPPKENPGALDLIARWSFTKADNTKAAGEIRYPGRVAFGSKPIDVVMLMDGSWSMTESDPKRQRVAAVRDFISTARNSAAIRRIGIVQFDSKSKTLIGMTPVDGNFESAVNAITAVGLTDIDGGIRHALNLIEPDHRNGAAIVLFTDGNQEPGEYMNAHYEARKAGVAIHTMTLGRDADRKLLTRIAEETGGSYADADKDNDISAAYGAIVSRITRLRTISTTELNAAKKSAQVPVDPTCSALYIATVAEKPGALKLQIPGGATWSSGELANPQYFAEKPAHGEWSAQWEWKAEPAAAVNIQVAASARTSLYPLFFRASPLPASPVEFDANDPRLAISLFDGAEPVNDARIVVNFEYVIIVNHENVTQRASIELSDDGKHTDGTPGDGVYGADIESLEFLAKEMKFEKGALSVVVTGTRHGQPYRRELQSLFTLKRDAPPALVVNGTYDLGEKFAGETATGDIHLRVRGTGGALKTTIENSTGVGQTPNKVGQTFLSAIPKLIDAPAALKSKEKRTQRLEVALPELLPAGDYSGTVRFEMTGVDSVKIPWRVKVLPVAFNAEPARLDLGSVLPGTTVKAKLKLATEGGSMTLKSVASPHLKNIPFTEFKLDKSGREIELEFAIADTAQAADLSHDLIFTDAENHERARIPVQLRVAPVKLNVEANLDFGTVESGDALKRDIVLKWGGTQNVPITPRLTLAAAALKPDLSALTPRDGGWVSNFAVTLPPETPTGTLSGTINIDAGPFKTEAHWTAKVVKPALAIDPATIDFGRVYPSRKSERKLSLRVDSSRPVAVEFSLAKPFAKPRVAGVEFPESALSFSKKMELAPGAVAVIPFTLAIPDDAQDGHYETILHIASRLGNFDIPLNVKAVNVVDAAAFHLTPTSMVFKITEGQALPIETLKIVSHDDEPLQLTLTVPASKAPIATDSAAAPPDAAAPPPVPPPSMPVAYLFNDSKEAQPEATMKVTIPPRGSTTVMVRPRPDARDAESGSIWIDGGGENQVVDLRVERYVPTQASDTVAPPEPPKLLGWILWIFVLVLLAFAVLVKYFVKQSGIRYVCYALIVHLIIFSLAMPQKVIMEALPESMEISLLDAQESLGISMSEQQSRRLDALHSGSGSADDKRAPVLAQAALPAAKEGPIELPATGAGPAAPRAGPANLEAAHGVESPIKPAALPEAARGAREAPMVEDAPLAFDADKTAPPLKEKPAPAEKLAPEAPRAVATTLAETAIRPVSVDTNIANVSQAAESVASIRNDNAAVPRAVSSAAAERSTEAPRRPVEPVEVARRPSTVIDDAPLNVGNDAPLAFDSQPAAAPQVQPNTKAPPPDPARNVPVSAHESELGAPGFAQLNASLTLSTPGAPGTLGSGPGETFVAMAKTSALPAEGSSAGTGRGAEGSTIGNAPIEISPGIGYGRPAGWTHRRRRRTARHRHRRRRRSRRKIHRQKRRRPRRRPRFGQRQRIDRRNKFRQRKKWRGWLGSHRSGGRRRTRRKRCRIRHRRRGKRRGGFRLTQRQRRSLARPPRRKRRWSFHRARSVLRAV